MRDINTWCLVNALLKKTTTKTHFLNSKMLRGMWDLSIANSIKRLKAQNSFIKLLRQ